MKLAKRVGFEMIAAGARKASAKAKKKNPRLLKVKGANRSKVAAIRAGC